MKPKVEVYRDDSGGEQPWRWRVRAANGQIIGRSEEGYTSHAYVLRVATERNPGLRVVER